MTTSFNRVSASLADVTKASLRRGQRLTTLDSIVSIWVLFAFTVAQPLLDLLGRNPEFFLARASPSIDIVLIALLLLFGIPGVLALVVIGARAAHPTLGAIAHAALFSLMVASLAVSLFARTPADVIPGWLQVAIGVVLGLALWAVYVRFAAARTVVRYATIGPIAFLLVFLLFSPTSQLVTEAGALDRPAGVTVGSPAPVVMIIFDEFPLASIIDSDGEIVEETFPNYSRLSREGIWFRNAMAVEQQTEQAIPTMLTGRHPADRDAIPITADYPLNLFSLLSDSYDVRAIESVTELCPDYACRNRSRIVAPAAERWEATSSDLAVVAGHTLLPGDLAAGLPSISNNWGDFTGSSPEARDDFNIVARFNEYVDADRRSEVDRFMDLLEAPADEPTLYFAHLLLPHIPWSYLETGQSYFTQGRAPGSTPAGWESDEWLVMQAQQRHLIQVQYTDEIIGEMIATLEQQGIYDESLVIVAADHGTADIPDVEHRRVITDETVGHIAAVPLFVKLPNMSTTGVDDYRAETIDMMPTIADVLDVDVPWDVDGTSLVAPDRPERADTTMYGPKGEVTFGTDGSEKLEVAATREDWFVTGDPYSLAPRGFGDLLGIPIEDVRPDGTVAGSIRLDHPERYDDVQLNSDPFPARLTGSVTRPDEEETELVLAVGLNGQVAAVVRTYTEDGPTRFQAMLPRDAFRTGANDIEVMIVGDADTQLSGSRPAAQDRSQPVLNS